MKPIVQLEDIYFGYEAGETVLNGLSFSLHEAEKIGLIGYNGSGKSTLLHIVMGLLKPSSGTIRVLGKPVMTRKDFLEVRRQIGLVFQNADDQLFSPTVLEDVAFGPLNLGKSPREARRMAMETLEELNLNGLEHRIAHKLSGGEKKLVSLATVLVMKPIALLLDEPTTGLDEDARFRITAPHSQCEAGPNRIRRGRGDPPQPFPPSSCGTPSPPGWGPGIHWLHSSRLIRSTGGDMKPPTAFDAVSVSLASRKACAGVQRQPVQ